MNTIALVIGWTVMFYGFVMAAASILAWTVWKLRGYSEFQGCCSCEYLSLDSVCYGKGSYGNYIYWKSKPSCEHYKRSWTWAKRTRS